MDQPHILAARAQRRGYLVLARSLQNAEQRKRRERVMERRQAVENVGYEIGVLIHAIIKYFVVLPFALAWSAFGMCFMVVFYFFKYIQEITVAYVVISFVGFIGLIIYLWIQM